MKRLLIRADAGNRIGTGHVMRSLSLAGVWQTRYGRSTLISCCESEALARRAAESGVEFIPLAAAYPDSRDIEETLQHIRTLQADGIVFDGYHFDPEYQQAIKASGILLMMIDDYAHQPRYWADVLVNQNIETERLSYSCDPGAQLLLGTRYALLQSQFLHWIGFHRQISYVGRKILVTLGGTDPDNVTLKAVRALQQKDPESFEAVVVLGSGNVHEAEVRGAIHAGRAPIRLIQDVTNMPEWMAWADMAISAGGTTCWELAFMGLPNIILVQAENQLKIAEGLNRAGVAINLGWHYEVSEQAIVTAVNDLLQHEDLRRQMSGAGLMLVDGFGASRVAEAFHQTIAAAQRKDPSRESSL
jgi:UDP-2,4-diacetamido-2,4,6-trideoxy-beta-L-altropyranose hydrolase